MTKCNFIRVTDSFDKELIQKCRNSSRTSSIETKPNVINVEDFHRLRLAKFCSPVSAFAVLTLHMTFPSQPVMSSLSLSLSQGISTKEECLMNLHKY